MHVTIAFVQTLWPNKPLYLAINFTSCVTLKNKKNTKIYAKNTKNFTVGVNLVFICIYRTDYGFMDYVTL